jgi:DNA-3-methyladenine glycosylase
MPDLLGAILAGDAVRAAPQLLGWTLLVDGVGGRIVEAEAYEPGDPASHAFRGETPRNRVMFGPPGHAYVYRSYGMHWMLNLVCRPAGEPAAVLIRALEPTAGIDEMRARRNAAGIPITDRDLCRGPGRLCQALGITGGLDGARLDEPPFVFIAPDGARPPVRAVAGPRVGVTLGAERDWRFVDAASRHLSRGVPRQRAR